jgi:DNA-binding CsgD family transcriptional regulator
MRKKWSLSENEKIADMIVNGSTQMEIADVMNVSYMQIKNHIAWMRRNDYVNNRKFRDWTTEEIELLYKYSGKKELSFIAKKIKRSKSAIYYKLDKLGLCSLKLLSGLYTINDISKNINIDWHTVNNWCISGLLKYVEYAPKEQNFKFISAKNFWEFAYNNKKLLIFRNIKRNTILPEPDWVDELRVESNTKNKKVWTKEDDTLLKDMFRQGYSYNKIAQSLNRSYAGITHRLSRLNINRVISIKWTDEEIQILKDNNDKLDSEIAYMLGRDITHIREKRKRYFNGCLRKNKKWTQEEEQFIINNYKKINISDIAKKLKIDKRQVETKISKMRKKKLI